MISTKDTDQVGVIFKQILEAAIADEATIDGKQWLNSWSKQNERRKKLEDLLGILLTKLL